jgi:hypothetical protein
MKMPYSFSVLRYLHDGVTGEFVNIGVAVYSPDAKYLRAVCTTQYSRITKVFDRIDGERFRQLVRFIQDAVNKLGERLRSQLEFEPIRSQTIDKVLAKVLPPDDSSIQFSPAGVGLSENMDETLRELHERYVTRYAGPADVPSRSDEEVWRVFREAMDQRNVAHLLTPKRIVAPDYEYEFHRAWKNDVWHVYEPVSFDLLDAASILDKANRWVGRGVNLRDSSEAFQMHLLLGAPQDRRLHSTYAKARNALRKMPVEPDLVEENEAEEFAANLERELGVHHESNNINEH